VSTIPPPEPRHGIAELLRLVGAVRRLAFPAAVGDAGQDQGHVQRLRPPKAVLVRHDTSGASSVRPGRRSVIPS
jgi:hypothetical protein